MAGLLDYAVHEKSSNMTECAPLRGDRWAWRYQRQTGYGKAMGNEINRDEM